MGAFIARLTIITPNCLKVERAIIFFMSHSVMADRPAISVVKTAKINKAGANRLERDKNG